MKLKWEGVFPAMTTKFTSHDELDFEAFNVNLQAQLDAGVDGIIIGGSLGEASTLANDEKDSLMRFTADSVARKVPVVMNIAESSTKKAVNAALRAADNGADGLMVLPPMQYAADDDETVLFLKSVARSTNLPVMIYNNPADYKIYITINMFRQLEEVPNIQAIKESSRDVTNVTRLHNTFGSRYSIFTGVDTLCMESLVMGAKGWVAGLVCAFPQETVAIYRLIRAGQYEEALKIFRWFLPVLELDVSPRLVQNIKLAESLTGLGNENVREPRLPLRGEERKRVIAIVKEALATRPELPDYMNVEAKQLV